ncbi:gliding motility protein GldC [Algivirga pacifica]|uniref:Gliding motility protein GldC n=1 Tax=Algivirga pacifica TaxID=1162670 RepID=A0ABP9D1F8_9BACT
MDTKEREIRIKVELDEQNIPEKIFWAAQDSEQAGFSETRAFNLSLWDHINKETLRIGLWGKEMDVDEMKFFAIDTIGDLSQMIATATGDEKMAKEMVMLCRKLTEHVKEEQLKRNNK